MVNEAARRHNTFLQNTVEDRIQQAEEFVFQGRRNSGFEGDDIYEHCVDDGEVEDIGLQGQCCLRSDVISDDNNHFLETKTSTGRQVKSSWFQVHQVGIWYSLLSAVIMALSGMAAAYLSGSIGPNQLVVSRMTIQLLCCLPIDAYQRVPFNHSYNAYLLLLLRSLLGTINTSVGYITYQLMPVSSAKSIQYSTPVFAGLLGWMLLRESCSLVDTLFSFLTLGGVFLIAQPPFLFGAAESGETSYAKVIGSMLSLLSAFLSASILIIMRKLGSYNMPSLTVLTFFSVFGACFSALLTSILQQWTLPGCELDRILLLGNGIGHFMSQVLIYLALKTERASTVALVHSSDIMFSFLLEYLIFGVIPNYFTAIGAGMIVASFVGITMKRWRESRGKEDENKSSTVRINNLD